MNHFSVLVAVGIFLNISSLFTNGIPQIKDVANADDVLTTPAKGNQNILEHLSVRAPPTCVDEMTGIPTRPYPSHMFFTADNNATMYLNGNYLGEIYDWTSFRTVMGDVQKGDVISIIAGQDQYWYGAIAAIHFNGQFLVTGKHNWRAVKAYTTQVPAPWMMPNFNACGWQMDVTRPNPNSYFSGKSKYFPFYTGAKYVWAKGVSEDNAKIFLRLKIGEFCWPNTIS